MTMFIARATMALVAFTALASPVQAQQGGSERRRTIVIDLTGRPLANARVRVAGGRTYTTDERGMVLLESVTAVGMSIDVTAIGYVPEQRTLQFRAAAAGNVPVDTVILMSLESVLDTVRISTAGAVGFDVRRKGKVGQFITVADLEREHPRNTTALLRTRDGMKLLLDRRGVPSIAMSGGDKGRTCPPLVLIDGFPAPPTTASPGLSAVDRSMHLDDVGGVELYINSAEIPAQFAIWDKRECGAIIFWTRAKLGLPPAPLATGRP